MAVSEHPQGFDPDLVVSWLAEIESGRIDRLRADIVWAARANAVDAMQWIELMEGLGILQLDWTARTWRAQPLALTALPTRRV
ncbi:hypothetical protein DQ384_04510 [Sphaerisporangium album]|uniref:Uncharacterized protein n=1 Tax=Sphaerisporangium album TaxID=509200 RepID=A0A367FQT1_9ACTN|nr:hypothetical protein [Sphaerisporangium album]RCG32743.1 hypothetical protein DQ384_04510 [Sphaerisporangium album]